MSLFRDQDGNLYEIPEGDLQRFRVQDEVPEGSELKGAELPGEPAPAGGRAGRRASTATGTRATSP